MEFYNLPTDLKRMIFNINREDAVNKRKKKFNLVIHELEGVVEESQFYFGYEDEDLKHVGLYQYVLEYISFNYDY